MAGYWGNNWMTQYTINENDNKIIKDSGWCASEATSTGENKKNAILHGDVQMHHAARLIAAVLDAFVWTFCIRLCEVKHSQTNTISSFCLGLFPRAHFLPELRVKLFESFFRTHRHRCRFIDQFKIIESRQEFGARFHHKYLACDPPSLTRFQSLCCVHFTHGCILNLITIFFSVSISLSSSFMFENSLWPFEQSFMLDSKNEWRMAHITAFFYLSCSRLLLMCWSHTLL